MICIAQNNAGIKVVFERFKTHALNCPRRANRHEDRRFDNSAARSQRSSTRFTIAGKHIESDRRLGWHVSRLRTLNLELCTLYFVGQVRLLWSSEVSTTRR